MKTFIQNEIRTNYGESNILPQTSQRHYTAAGAAILVIIILHFVSQFIFVQNENTSRKIEAINHRSVQVRPENEQSGEPKTEPVAKQPEVEAMSEVNVPVVEPKTKAVPARVAIKKKAPPESRAERLRRAEKLLTGV